MKKSSHHHHFHLHHHNTSTQPCILIGCADGCLGLAIAVLLSGLNCSIEVVLTAKALEERTLEHPFDLVITPFVELLAGQNSLPRRVAARGYHTPFFALLRQQEPEHDIALTLNLLASGASQVLALPLSAARLYQKAKKELQIDN